MSALPFLHSLLHRTEPLRFGILDLLLILLGVLLAYGLLPGLTEGPGF